MPTYDNFGQQGAPWKQGPAWLTRGGQQVPQSQAASEDTYNRYNRADDEFIIGAPNTSGISEVGQTWRGTAEGRLGDLYAGKDSAAAMQAKLGLAQAQGAMGAASIGRGANPLAQRAAINAGGAMQSRAVSEAALLRAQEMQAAYGDLYGAYGGQQAGYTNMAQLDLQRSMAQADAHNAALGLEQSSRQQDMQLVGTVIGAAGAAAGAMSDEKVKTLQDAPAGGPGPAGRERAEDATIGGMRGVRYLYEPGAVEMLGQPPGQQYGPTAQQLEATPLGGASVYDTPAGKAVDGERLAMTTAGLLGRVGERQDTLEQRLARLEASLRGRAA